MAKEFEAKPQMKISELGVGNEFIILDFGHPKRSGIFEVISLAPVVTMIDRDAGRFTRVGMETLMRYGGDRREGNKGRTFVPYSRTFINSLPE